MTPDRPNPDHSIRSEPHLGPTPGEVDASEARADETLAREARRPATTYSDAQNVRDEPDIFPRAAETVERDWMCSACGYNLRGLDVGHPCPECHHVELYRPPPDAARSYGLWLEDGVAATAASTTWLMVAAGPLWGLVGAMLALCAGSGAVGLNAAAMLPLVLLYVAPAEELLKIALIACIIDVRPYLYRTAGQIYLSAAGAALAFAAAQNLMFFLTIARKPGLPLLMYRWLAWPAIQLGCSLVVAAALVRVWRRCLSEGRRPRVTGALPGLVLAIVLHGATYAIALALEQSYGPWR